MMNRRNFMAAAGVAALWARSARAVAQPQTTAPDLGALADRKGLTLVNRTAERLVDRSRVGVRLSAAAGEGTALLPGVQLANGTIEIDIRGKDTPRRKLRRHGISRDRRLRFRRRLFPSLQLQGSGSREPRPRGAVSRHTGVHLGQAARRASGQVRAGGESCCRIRTTGSTPESSSRIRRSACSLATRFRRACPSTRSAEGNRSRRALGRQRRRRRLRKSQSCSGLRTKKGGKGVFSISGKKPPDPFFLHHPRSAATIAAQSSSSTTPVNATNNQSPSTT